MLHDIITLDDADRYLEAESILDKLYPDWMHMPVYQRNWIVRAGENKQGVWARRLGKTTAIGLSAMVSACQGLSCVIICYHPMHVLDNLVGLVGQFGTPDRRNFTFTPDYNKFKTGGIIRIFSAHNDLLKIRGLVVDKIAYDDVPFEVPTSIKIREKLYTPQ